MGSAPSNRRPPSAGTARSPTPSKAAHASASSSFHCPVDAAEGVGDGSADRAASSGVRIRCERCGTMTSVPLGTVAFACRNCGVRVRVMLNAMSKVAGLRVNDCIKEAQQSVKAILREQAAICRKLWNDFGEEVAVQNAIWMSQSGADEDRLQQVSSFVQEVTAARDVTQIDAVLLQVESLGLPPVDATFRNTLERLRSEEDLEVIWRCLSNAVAERDRVDLELWRDEIVSRGLHIPEEVESVILAVQNEECARLAELGFNANFAARTNNAIERGDTQALEALIKEARIVGQDTSKVEAALSKLSQRPSSAGPTKPPPQPPPPCQTQPPRPAATPQPSQTQPSKPQAQSPRPTATPQAQARSSGTYIDPGPSWSGRASGARPQVKRPQQPQSAEQQWSSQQTPPQRPSSAGPTRTRDRQASSSGSANTTGDANTGNSRPATAPQGMTRVHALQCLGFAQNQDPSLEDLRKAYKLQALRWHPDRRQNHTCGEEAKERFQDVRASFEYLQAGCPRGAVAVAK